MSNSTTDLAGVQRSARQVQSLAEFTIPLLMAAIGLPLIGSLYLAAAEAPAGSDAASIAVDLAGRLITAAPSLLLAFAVFGARAVLAEYAEGRYLSAAASRALKGMGQWAIWALLLKFVAAPILVALLRGEPLAFPLSGDMFDAGVLLFAVFILVIGGVLEAAAAALKAENDQIV